MFDHGNFVAGKFGDFRTWINQTRYSKSRDYLEPMKKQELERKLEKAQAKAEKRLEPKRGDKNPKCIDIMGNLLVYNQESVGTLEHNHD